MDNTEGISFLSAVSELDLTGNNFERFPNLGQFPMLQSLKISYCKRLKSLPELPPHLKWLTAWGCTSLESIGDFHLHWNKDYSYKFIDCFNLIPASSEIIANAHHNIQLIAAEDVERFSHQVLWKGLSSAYFSLPTTEIPPWFNVYQSIGSSVVVQLPPCGQNGLFLGFELCIVVESSEEDKSGRLWWVQVDCHFKSYQGSSREFNYSSFWHPRWHSDREPMSDQLLLFYDQILYAKVVEGDEGDFSGLNSQVEASFQFRIGGPADDYTHMIKKCGVHLLYEENEEHITSNEGQPSRTLSIEEEEDDTSTGNRGRDDSYCYSGNESVANLGNGNRDQDLKETLRKFSLCDFLVRCLNACDLRNFC